MKTSKGNPLIGTYNRKPPGESSISAIIDTYKQNCKKHNRTFELNRDEVIKLVTDICHYCGSAPIPRKINKKLPDLFAAHGIDRVDNNLGYIRSNCVTCCKTCNRAKHTLTYTDFKNWLLQVTKFNADI